MDDDDLVYIETHGDLGIPYFKKPSYVLNVLNCFVLQLPFNLFRTMFSRRRRDLSFSLSRIHDPGTLTTNVLFPFQINLLPEKNASSVTALEWVMTGVTQALVGFVSSLVQHVTCFVGCHGLYYGEITRSAREVVMDGSAT